MSDNSVTIVGNLTRDPEVKTSAAGLTTVTRIGLAHNRRWFNKKTNDFDEEVSFFNAVAFGELGDNVASTLHKGDRVVLVGRLQQRSWETDDGEKRSVVEIVADDVTPSLRWATATVARVEREKVGGSRPPVPNTDEGYDEEPF